METTHCTICGFNECKVIGVPSVNSTAKEIIKTDYMVVQCENCGLYFVSPKLKLTKGEWEQLYNSDYFIANTGWLEKKRKSDLKKRLDKLKSYITVEQVINFLDIGCGQGYSLIESLSRGWKTTGIDIHDNRIAAARVNGINFYWGNLSEAGLKLRSYDIIYVDSVLEHIPDPMAYLKIIKELLKPGGVVYIGVPNEDSFLNDIRMVSFRLSGKRERSAKIKPFENPYHIIGFNKASLKYMIVKSGLNLIYIHNFSRKLELLGFRLGSSGFWKGILLLPVEFGGWLFRRDTYFEVILQ